MANQKQPLGNFHFEVEWGGTRLGFTEVSGLDMEYEVLEYRDGNQPDFTSQKVPGLKKFSNVVLKRGVVVKGDNEFFTHFDNARNENYKRTISIRLLNEQHKSEMIWTVRKAWPVALKCSELDASNSKIMIESLEMAHEGIEISIP